MTQEQSVLDRNLKEKEVTEDLQLRKKSIVCRKMTIQKTVISSSTISRDHSKSKIRDLRTLSKGVNNPR